MKKLRHRRRAELRPTLATRLPWRRSMKGSPDGECWRTFGPRFYLGLREARQERRVAEALCEAVTRPSMRFVPVKSKERQAACMLMTVRERLVSVKSQFSNAFSSYAAEFGIVGRARDLFRLQADEYAAVEARLAKIEA